MLGLPCNGTVIYVGRTVRCRALSGCCVATSLVACPGLSIAREVIPLGRGIGGNIAAVLPGLKLGSPSYPLYPLHFLWTMLVCGSHHLISQAGCNRCNLTAYLLTYLKPAAHEACAMRNRHDALGQYSPVGFVFHPLHLSIATQHMRDASKHAPVLYAYILLRNPDPP